MLSTHGDGSTFSAKGLQLVKGASHAERENAERLFYPFKTVDDCQTSLCSNCFRIISSPHGYHALLNAEHRHRCHTSDVLTRENRFRYDRSALR